MMNEKANGIQMESVEDILQILWIPYSVSCNFKVFELQL